MIWMTWIPKDPEEMDFEWAPTFPLRFRFNKRCTLNNIPFPSRSEPGEDWKEFQRLPAISK